MMNAKLASNIQSNFDLKTVAVNLSGEKTRHEGAGVGLTQLEAMRASRSAISASKYGLETICGASCDTGAQ